MTRGAAKRKSVQTHLFVAALAATSLVSVVAQVPVQDQQPAGSALRPAVMGPSGGVSTGHPLTTAAAFGILLKGGNAFDAGVASLLAGGVLEQDLYSLGGEALVLVYPRRSQGHVDCRPGLGAASRRCGLVLTRGKTLEGAGLDPAVVPGALHAALTVLERWGTMSFEDVVAPAIGYAEHGFPIRSSTVRAIENQLEFFERWPGNKAYWLKPDGSHTKPARPSSCRPARTLRRMVEAERGAKPRGRAAGIMAARDRFYKGDIAREMVAFLRQHDAPFDESRFRRLLRSRRGAGTHDLPRLHRLQARLRQSGPRAAADTEHPRAVRSARDGLRQRRLPPHDCRGDEARLRGSRYVLCRPGVRADAIGRSAVEGLRERARSAHRPETRIHRPSWRAIRCGSTPR